MMADEKRARKRKLAEARGWLQARLAEELPSLYRIEVTPTYYDPNRKEYRVSFRVSQGWAAGSKKLVLSYEVELFEEMLLDDKIEMIVERVGMEVDSQWSPFAR
jgi:hypothetical protein